MILVTETSAQGNLKGIIAQDNERLAFVHLMLQPGSFQTTTDINGEFLFTNLPEGDYTLQGKHVGYKPIQQSIQVTSGATQYLEIAMKKDVLGLNEMTVTANRNEENRKTAPVIVSIMNSAQLEKLSANSISEGIKFSPGLRMENNCQNCGFSQVRINGLPGAYSQVLIDGKAVFSALNSIYGLEQIPTDMVDRIEIIKGGGSALYGSNAIAGTINLITKDPIRNSVSVKTEAQLIGEKSWEYNGAAAATMVQKDFKRGISVFGNYRNRSSYDHDGDQFSELPTLNNIGMGLRSFQKTGKRGKLNLEFHALNEYRRGGDQLSLAPHESNIAEELKSSVYGGSVGYDLFGKKSNNKYSIYTGLQLTEMDNYYGAGMDPDGYGNTTDLSSVTGFQYTNKNKGPFSGKGTFLAGVEYRYDDMKDEKPGYGLFIQQKLETIGSFLQYDWKINGRWILNTGIRYDWYNLNNGGNVSPRLNLLYTLTPNVTLRGGYSRGFRIPQVFSDDVHVELVAGSIQAIRLAPKLDAEISDSYTMSMDWDKDWSNGEMEIVVEGFYTQIYNPFVLEEIQTDVDFSVLEKRNGSAATILGSNLEFKITDQKRYALQAGYTLLQSEFEKALQWSTEAPQDQFTKKMLRTPNAYGSVLLDIYPIKSLTINLSAIHTGKMYVPHFAGYTQEDRLETTPDFFEVNARVSYDLQLKRPAFKTTIYAGCKNILNQYQSDFDRGINRDASYIYGPLAPRTIYFGFKWAWN